MIVRRGLTFCYFWVILIMLLLELPGFRFLGAGLFLFVFSIVTVIFISIFIGAPFVFPLLTVIIIVHGPMYFN